MAYIPTLSAPTVSGEITASDFKPSGRTGATAASRYVGATASGAPASGTFAVGDFVIDQTGKAWVCTVAGTPGTWTQLAGGSSTLAADTDVSLSSPVGGQVLGYNNVLSKWVNQNQAGLAATTSTAQLGANVTMTTGNTWYDILSVALTPGTWLLIGNIHALASQADALNARLWDGTTTLATASQETVSGADYSETVSAIVSPSTSTTYRLAALCVNGGTVVKTQTLFDPAGNTATYLQAIQLSGNPVGQQAPAVRVYNSANISCANGATTILTFDTNRFDQGTSTSQHSTSANTSRLTCQQAGVYHIGASLLLANNTTGERYASILLNGTTRIAETGGAPDTVGTNGPMLQPHALYQLNVGDYVEVQVFQNSGGALNVLGSGNGNYGAEFWMARIDSGPGAVQPNTKVQLDASPSSGSDVANGSALSTNAWNDVWINQTFNVDDPNSVVDIEVSSAIYVPATSASLVSARLVIDSAGTSINKNLCGGGAPANANAIIVGGLVSVTGLTAGSHTVKLQVYPTGTSSTLYLRTNTAPITDFLTIRVLERKQSSSPPSSTPAPAVRCNNSAAVSLTSGSFTTLSFDTNEFDQGTSSPQHSTSTNPSRLTCRQAGVYVIHATANFSSNATGARLVAILLNGTTWIAWQNVGANPSNNTTLSVSTAYALVVGDYVEVEVFQSSGGALTLNGFASNQDNPVFGMARVDTGSAGVLNVYKPNATASITAVNSLTIVQTSSTTQTLPTAAGVTGQSCIVKNASGVTATTIATTSSQTIDGASTYSLVASLSSVTLTSDGTNWQIT
jgi:hypothetical protein